MKSEESTWDVYRVLQIGEALAWRVLWIAIRVAMWCAVLGAVVCSSIVMYSLLYWAVIPKTSLFVPVYLDYRETNDSFAEALVNLEHRGQWNQLVRDPSERSSLALGKGFRYDVFLQVDAFDTPINRKCGLFMAHIAMQSGGQTTAASTRALVPQFHPWVVRTAKDVLLAVPSLIGLYDHAQTLRLQLFEEWFELPAYPTSTVKMQLYGDTFHIKAATLQFIVRLRGIRWLLYHWFFTSALIGIGQLTLFNMVLLAGLYYALFIQSPTTPYTLMVKKEPKEEERIKGD